MTAEIAVMNKGAIALAADSKVTVSSGGVTKTYDTVSKLFTLSKVAPVGVMIYGNADFMGYPWETIIKLFRHQQGRRTRDHVSGWADDFFSFLDKFGNITPTDRLENVEDICLSTLFDAIRSFEEYARSQALVVGTTEYEDALRKVIAKRASLITSAPAWAAKRQQTAMAKYFSEPIGKAILAGLDGYNDETKSEAITLLLATLLLKVGSPQTSGIVVAGFGDKEYFPSLVEYRVDGYVGKKIKRFLVEPVIDLSRKQNACVRAFAQKEMVQRFMEGIDPFYSLYLSRVISDTVIDNCFQTLDKYGSNRNKTDKTKENIREAVEQAINGFEKEALLYRVRKFSDPVMAMVSVLPKDELAHLAESLVALTSLKRRVSSDAETVGGAIDVALISKGDGFVWIKHKHYFSEELNRQFVRTYMDGMESGDASHGKSARPGGSRKVAAKRSVGKAPTPG